MRPHGRRFDAGQKEIKQLTVERTIITEVGAINPAERLVVLAVLAGGGAGAPFYRNAPVGGRLSGFFTPGLSRFIAGTPRPTGTFSDQKKAAPGGAAIAPGVSDFLRGLAATAAEPTQTNQR